MEIKNIEFFDTSEVTTMAGMFYACTSLTFIDISHFDMSNVVTTTCIESNFKRFKR